MTNSSFRLLPGRAQRCAAGLLLACAPLFSPAQEAAPTTLEPLPPAVSADAPELVGDLAPVPAPVLTAKAWITLDMTSGQVIAAENADERVEPASLTKLMTAYLVFEALESKRLSLEQTVHVSEKAWKIEGSRMFIKPGSQVTVDDLLQGVIVQSGNDATVALAEAVAGSESAFAALMNEEAARQGLKETHFTNASGLPDPAHVTSVRDLAVMAQNLIARFPQYMHYYKQKDYTYNNIKQNNRNRLLWTDETVDGLKTGQTQSAGYCLVATALRDGRRVLTVLVGASSEAARMENSLKLLNWSFQNFDTVKLYDADMSAVTARVWQGEADTVELGTSQPIWVTVPRGQGQQLTPVLRYTQPLLAPLQKGAQVGDLTLSLNGVVLRTESLHALADVPEAGFFGRLYDKVRLMFE